MIGLDVARQKLGLQEVRDRIKLMDFFKQESKNGDIVIDPARIPWCAAFINGCERAVGNPGTGLLNARSFLKYGKVINEEDAQPGDILIFARGSNGYSGHVTYFLEWDDDNNTVKCLGGNQSDMVCVAIYSQDRLLGVRRFK